MIGNSVMKELMNTADLVTFTEEILNRKLHFLCSDSAPKIKHTSVIFKDLQNAFHCIY